MLYDMVQHTGPAEADHLASIARESYERNQGCNSLARTSVAAHGSAGDAVTPSFALENRSNNASDLLNGDLVSGDSFGDLVDRDLVGKVVSRTRTPRRKKKKTFDDIPLIAPLAMAESFHSLLGGGGYSDDDDQDDGYGDGDDDDNDDDDGGEEGRGEKTREHDDRREVHDNRESRQKNENSGEQNLDSTVQGSDRGKEIGNKASSDFASSPGRTSPSHVNVEAPLEETSVAVQFHAPVQESVQERQSPGQPAERGSGEMLDKEETCTTQNQQQHQPHNDNHNQSQPPLPQNETQNNSKLNSNLTHPPPPSLHTPVQESTNPPVPTPTRRPKPEADTSFDDDVFVEDPDEDVAVITLLPRSNFKPSVSPGDSRDDTRSSRELISQDFTEKDEKSKSVDRHTRESKELLGGVDPGDGERDYDDGDDDDEEKGEGFSNSGLAPLSLPRDESGLGADGWTGSAISEGDDQDNTVSSGFATQLDTPASETNPFPLDTPSSETTPFPLHPEAGAKESRRDGEMVGAVDPASPQKDPAQNLQASQAFHFLEVSPEKSSSALADEGVTEGDASLAEGPSETTQVAAESEGLLSKTKKGKKKKKKKSKAKSKSSDLTGAGAGASVKVEASGGNGRVEDGEGSSELDTLIVSSSSKDNRDSSVRS
jgi:hypothetical protein